MAYANSGSSTLSGFAARIRGFFADFAERWEEQRRVRRTITELQNLSDAELVDLGFSRHDISRVAMESVYGPLNAHRG